MSAASVGGAALGGGVLADLVDVPAQGSGPLTCEVDGVEIGLYRVGEGIVAWRNVCPHEAAPVCRGPIAGTRLESAVHEYKYGRHQEVVRCPWHGWEFDLRDGAHLAAGSNARLRGFGVEVRDGRVYPRRSGAEAAIALCVEARTTLADRVVELRLRARDGARLPAWAPGAHAELRLPSGLVRHYSLCGDPRERDAYTIAVRHEPDGRGGSTELHALAEGAELELVTVRNRMPLVAASAFLFVAGGIGVTPLLPLAEAAGRGSTPSAFVYAGVDAAAMAYRDRVRRLAGHEIVESRRDGRPELASRIAALPDGAAIYCCGPEGLMDDVRRLAAQAGIALHAEAFSPATGPGGQPFDLVLAGSGERIAVGADESALSAVRRAGHTAASSCEQGWCGSCEVAVRAGDPDHRDEVLTAAERDAGGAMMLCVSRGLGEVTVEL
ncbi:Rieske 2Fe-2S domain-containing protein [Microbacterium sp. NEAU-LLC]|uniref:Rieske 2Fe-2S domain-containing protein n=1 Tax=Microbacterium helvum TaxID=2773713 RepID=A0ABR8NN57_9MICO|nr:Rieske 2Fe-2S domain-containing protein [Microbacterium helvum]MBD3942093.1 Rieske 2Fe-2S domain-containing protein [Microbacterium helvum]